MYVIRENVFGSMLKSGGMIWVEKGKRREGGREEDNKFPDFCLNNYRHVARVKKFVG